MNTQPYNSSPGLKQDSKINRAWSSLESERALFGSAAHWRSFIGDEFPRFKSAFLNKQPQPSTTIWCEKCFRHHLVIESFSSSSSSGLVSAHSPIRIEDEKQQKLSLLATDPGTDEHVHCPDFPIFTADIEIWELNWHRLARALCHALELESRFASLNLINTCQIGAWSADAIPVLLTIQPDRNGLRSIVSELLARLRQQFILLTPTNKNLDAKIQELLANAGAVVFPLETTVTLTENGVLQPRLRPGELFARFAPEPKLPEDAALRAFAVIKSLDANPNLREAPVFTVFRLYCMENLSVQQIAKKLRCSKATIINRLRTIRQKTGVNAKALRAYSTQFGQIENSLSDPKARRIHRRAAMDDPSNDEA
jgi:hypothetical protein